MTFETLLVPTDGSDVADATARRAFDFAEALDASVHVLSVADSAVATGVGYSGERASIREQLKEKAAARATSLRRLAADRGLDATAVTREGIPAEEIVDYATSEPVDGIVIGTSGRGGIARAVVGSVTDKVVRAASVPVVTITPEAAESDDGWTPIESILLPTDGSEAATAALDCGLELAEQFDATVHLLSVADSDLASALDTVSDDAVDSSNHLLEQAETYLDTLATDARDRDLEVVITAVEGTPSEKIVEYAASEDVDLIAMGTTGRGGFERVLLGSVTDDVIRTATKPVMILPDVTNYTGRQND